MRYNMLGAPQAKILWSAPSKSRFYYLFWLLELMPGHLRRSILRILVLNPTHEVSWSRSGFFSLRGRILRAGPLAPLCFLVFVSSPPPSALQVPGRPLTERSKTLGPGPRWGPCPVSSSPIPRLGCLFISFFPRCSVGVVIQTHRSAHTPRTNEAYGSSDWWPSDQRTDTA